MRACELQEETKRVRMRECAYMFACANEKENAFVRDRAHACVCMCVREKEKESQSAHEKERVTACLCAREGLCAYEMQRRDFSNR